MRTDTIIDTMRRRLAVIRSNRDPAMFQSMRAFVRDERTLNRSVIVNFADQDKPHGCRFKCDFCSWRERAEREGDLAPSPAALDRFLDGFAGSVVTISGGGDPLFKLEKNIGRLLKLVRQIHRRGFLVEIVTMEWDEVTQNAGSLLREVDLWSMSAQGRSGRLWEAITAAQAADQLVRVSRVCSPKSDWATELEYWVNFYQDAGAYQCVLREDFNARGMLTEAEARAVAQQTARSGVRWLPSATCEDNLFLIGDVVHRGEAALGAALSTSS